MKIGLVGLPGCGKSTTFNALTGLAVETGYGGRAGRASYGSVKVPDHRVDALAALYRPRRTVYGEITFIDLGVASAGRNVDRALLNSMREVDALCQVVRDFPGPDGEPPRPYEEITALETETILADLEIVERRVQRLAKDRSNPRELELLVRLQTRLEDGTPLRALALAPEERKMLSGYRFLSEKPLLWVLNVAEEALAKPPPPELAAAAGARGIGLVVLSAAVEMDIAHMPAPEQREFLHSIGVAESAKARFIAAAFALLDLITMLTAGPDECRAWPIPRNTKAPQAAGKIHSDLERGFIRAEVIAWSDWLELGGEAACRDAGKLRVEGKDYVIQDGDVVHFRFNV